MVDKKAQGKANRAKGARFELKVRKDLIDSGWIVDKWTNNVEFGDCEHCNKSKEDHYYKENFCENVKDYNLTDSEFEPTGKLHPAKSFRGRSRSNGFPDFIAFREIHKTIRISGPDLYEVIAVEVKSNGTLRKAEKEKCDWYLDNNIFSKILIASNGDKRGKIVYKEFERGLKK